MAHGMPISEATYTTQGMNGLPMTQETGWPSTACCVISWVTACGPDFMKRSIHGSCSNGSVVSKPSKKESNLSLPIPMGVGVFMVRFSGLLHHMGCGFSCGAGHKKALESDELGEP
ncbi:hypothetical protein AAC387_Pa03g4300 [Persea americana]